MFKIYYFRTVFKSIVKKELRLLSTLSQQGPSTLNGRTSKQDITSVAVPSFLKLLSYKSLRDEVHSEQLQAFKRLPVVYDVKVLSAMYENRLYDSARIFLRIRLENPSNLTPASFLRMCEFIKDIYLDGAEVAADQELISVLREQFPHMPDVCVRTAKFYLTCCNDFDEVPALPPNLIERKGVVAAVLCNLLKQNRVQDFKSLLMAEPAFPILSSKPLLSWLSKVVKSAPYVSEWFLDRMILEGVVPETSLISPTMLILKNSKLWNVKSTYISRRSRCGSCRTVLVEEKGLTGENFEQLRKAVRKYVFNTAEKFSRALPREIEALLSQIRQLPQVKGRSLVVDGLNTLGGRMYRDLLYKKLLFALQDFDSVMLILREGEPAEMIERIKQLNVSVFLCSKRSDDDLFTLLSALERGPRCYILSNDRFRCYDSHLRSLDAALFRKWLHTRLVRHHSMKTGYFLPASYTILPQCKNDIYHLPFVQKCTGQMYADKYMWFCIRKCDPSVECSRRDPL